MYVIYNKPSSDFYELVTFLPDSKPIKETRNIRACVEKMDGKGTPIFTYS